MSARIQVTRDNMSPHAADVTAALLRRGWVQERASDKTTLWSLPTSSPTAELYVPHGLRRDTIEWVGVLERIAAPTGENPRDVEMSIEKSSYDVLSFRVNSTGETIPLESAATVINSAFGMIRAAATAARRPRQAIGNYSKLGDRIASSARLGHTQHGSFVFPVLVHIDEPAEPEKPVLDGTQTVTPESEERRVTRTLAQAMAAFEKQVIQPAAEPTAKSLLPVVIAGGTREMFGKLAGALAEPDISFVETRFTWAGNEPASFALPTSVAIPADAHDLVTEAARVLSKPARDPLRVIVGPIIQIGQTPGEPFGEIIIQAPGPSGGRLSRVEMAVRQEQMEQLADWMLDGTTVVVHGAVDVRPGRRTRLREVATPQPLSDTLTGIDT